MATHLSAPNISLAWLRAIEHLLSCGGRDINVMVTVEHAGAEDSHIRQTLDEFLRSPQGRKAASVATVANTLFPQALYHSHLGPAARPHLYRMHRRGYAKTRQYPANRAGTYFHRLIDWPGCAGNVNQLERVVERLRRQLSLINPKSSIYELAVSVAEDTEPGGVAGEALEMRIFNPSTDTRIRGFPCLSHISLTLHRGRLHMTALYRNQAFLHKAYGNYVGLSRLLQFICQEIGCEAGEITCVATHADVEIEHFTKRALTSLVERCRVPRSGGDVVLLPRRKTAS